MIGPATASRVPPHTYAIDFGTSNSLVVAAMADGSVSAPVPVDPGAPDPTILRSILYYPEDPKSVAAFGQEALDSYAEAGMQGRLLRSLKRFLPDPGFGTTLVGQRKVSLEELIAAILRTLRLRANEYFEVDVTRVLLGRPAVYDPNPDHEALAVQRMTNAARLAGFRDVAFFAEPVAAARDFEADLTTRKVVLVADFGGGTSDFTIVRMDHEGFSASDVLATAGVSVAGDALDGALMRRELARHFGSEMQYKLPMGTNVLTMPAALMDALCTPAKLPLLQSREVQRFLKEVRSYAHSPHDRELVERFLAIAEDARGFSVFESVEHTKRALSTQTTATFDFEYADIDVHQEVSRERFEQAITPATNTIAACIDETLAAAHLTAADVDLVCLTGGTSRVPRVEQLLVSRFGSERLRRLKGLHSVVTGLGLEAARHVGAVL
jgi:hypothetical chaperone protein